MGKELKYSHKSARVLRFSSAYVCVCSIKVQCNKTKPHFGGVELRDFIIVTWELCSASYNVISFNPVILQAKKQRLLKVLQCVLFNTRDMCMSSF